MSCVEINCRNGFRCQERCLSRVRGSDITLHIAASHPLYVSRDQVPETLVEAERDIYAAQVTGKPANILDIRSLMARWISF